MVDCSEIGSGPYICPYCTKEFSRKRNVDRHILIHLGTKPFSCHICDYSANRKDNLLSHIKLRHSQFKL